MEDSLPDILAHLFSKVFCVVLTQEASDDGSLGDAPFKLLNVGLSGAALAHVLVLAPLLGSDTAGPFLPALLGVWGTALAVSGINLLKSGRD